MIIVNHIINDYREPRLYYYREPWLSLSWTMVVIIVKQIYDYHEPPLWLSWKILCPLKCSCRKSSNTWQSLKTFICDICEEILSSEPSWFSWTVVTIVGYDYRETHCRARNNERQCDGHIVIVRSNVFLLGHSQFWPDKYLPVNPFNNDVRILSHNVWCLVISYTS
jgi:hypothetical protein